MKNKREKKYPDHIFKSVACFFITAIFFYLLTVLCPITSAAETSPEPSGDKLESVETLSAAEERAPGEGFSIEDFGAQARDESYAGTIFKLLLVLGIMGAGFYYFFRFVSRQTGMRVLGRDVVNILSVVPLGPNKYLQVIDLDGRVLVLGVTDSNINLITEVTSKTEIDRMRLLSSKSSVTDKPAFQDQFVGFISGIISRIGDKAKTGIRAVRPSEQEYSEDYLYYLKTQKDRLKKMNGQKDD